MQRVLAPTAAGAVGLLALTGCLDTGSEPAPTATATVTETATAPAPEPEATEDAEVAEDIDDEDPDTSDDDFGTIGDTVTNFGAELTLHDAYMSDTIPWNEIGQPDGAATSREPDDGQWFVLETTVDNVGSVSMDLTCSWPIDAVAVDTEEREFDTIDSQYEYEGNPECNDNLQPGFGTEMTYVFNVPDDAEMIGMAFRDTEESEWGDYSAFIFDPAID